VLHEILGLFATTEVFVYVFMEVATHIAFFQKVMSKMAAWHDTVFFILIMGGFSIFGTYTGIVLPSGAISSIRDLGPMIAGLIAGPIAGLGAGIIGGMHRYFLGGVTCLPCGVATVLAGLIGGGVYIINKKKLIGVFYGMLLAVFVEFIHGVVTIAIFRPFDEGLKIVFEAIPPMMIANAMATAICIIVLERVYKEIKESKQLSG